MVAKKTLASQSASTASLVRSAARVSEPVTLSSGSTIPVRGLSVLEFVSILGRFPELRAIVLNLIGAGDEGVDEGFKAQAFDAFFGAGPNAIAHMIASAMGGPGDEDLVVAILDLGDEDLITLLDRVIALTMPDGMSGFFERLAGIAARMGLFADDDQLSAEAA